jgi:hypothetical protein
VWPSDTPQALQSGTGSAHRYVHKDIFIITGIEATETSRNKSDFWVRVCSIPVPSLSWATLLFGYQRLHITNSDCGVCIWPWHWFALGNTDLLYVTRCIPVKNTLDWSAVAFCVCEITQLFSVVFWVVRAVHTFDFRIVMNESPNKWRPIFVYRTTSCNDTDSRLRQDLCFTPINLASVKGLPRLCRSNALSWVRTLHVREGL